MKIYNPLQRIVVVVVPIIETGPDDFPEEK